MKDKEKKKRSARIKEFKHCEVCGEDVPREKFPKHQYWLAGVRATLCKGMEKAKRRFYEEQSKKRLRKAKAQARANGYRTPKEIEIFLRGLNFGLEIDA